MDLYHKLNYLNTEKLTRNYNKILEIYKGLEIIRIPFQI